MQEDKILLCHGAKDLPLCVRELLDHAFQKTGNSIATSVGRVGLVLDEVGRYMILESLPRVLFDQRLFVEGQDKSAAGLCRRFASRLPGPRISGSGTRQRKDKYGNLLHLVHWSPDLEIYARMVEALIARVKPAISLSANVRS